MFMGGFAGRVKRRDSENNKFLLSPFLIQGVKAAPVDADEPLSL